MVRQRLQLAFLHVAVTMTAVPIQSALSRVMIKELALPATLVAVLAAFPYIFSPLQVGIGSLSDRHPVAGRRRTPSIVLGLLLCAAGLALSPMAAYLVGQDRLAGLAAAFLVFGAWGIGFNFATVSYFSLAAELSGEEGRSRTVAVMFFFMVVGIIVTSAILSRLLEPYSPAALTSAFLKVAAGALVLGALGVIGLEKRSKGSAAVPDRSTWGQRFAAIAANAHAIMFFFYLIFLLAAILGQDILLGPFAGIALGMSVRESTGVTSVWGTFTLITLVLGGILGGRVKKRLLIVLGSAGAAAAFLVIMVGGLIPSRLLFYIGVSALGLATGMGTVANLSFMLDMTTHGRVGLFMGAWGMADAIARLVGNLVGGGVRDLVARSTGEPLLGFIAAFGLFILMLAVSLSILPSIDVGSFRRAVAEAQ